MPKKTEPQKDIITLRTSERTLYAQCRQAWWWGYVERLRIIEPQVPLEFGTLVHEALRLYYKPGLKRGPHPAKSFAKLYDQYLIDHDGRDMYMKADDESAERVTAGDMGDEMLCNYVNLYGKDQNIEVLVPEQLFQVEVRNEAGVLICTYVGQIDAVIRDLRTREVGFFEHKTGAGLDPFGAPVELDEQSGSYWTFAPEFLRQQGLLKAKEEVSFVLFNRLKKAMGDSRPKNEEGLSLNQNGSISKRQPGPLFKREFVYKTEHNRMVMYDRVVSQATEMQMVKDGILAVTKTPGRHCLWCPFFKTGMCQVHEDGSDWESIRDSMFTVWEPYSEHEIYAEGRR